MNRPLGTAAPLAALVLAGSLLAGCAGGSNSDEAAGDVVRITYIADLTGPGAFYGEDWAAGAEYAVDEINDAGGIGGRTLEIDVVDSASDQAAAVGAMNSAARSDSSVVMYALLSQNALAMAPVAQREEVPFIVGQSSVDGVTDVGDFVYRTSTSEGDYYGAMLRNLQEQGVESTAILYAGDNPTAVTNATERIPAIAEELGIEVTDTIEVRTADTDYSQPASRIVEGSPDAVANLTFGPAVTTSIQALRSAGYDGPLYGTSALGSGALTPAGDAAVDTYYPSAFIPAADLPWASGVAFLEEYEAATGDQPSFSTAGGHDQVAFLAAALESIGEGEVTRNSLKDALAVVAADGFVGATGDPIRFGEDRIADTPGVLVRWDGTTETVAPGQQGPLLDGYTGNDG
ncbi:ABC transporter substrate-binding protein [Nocardioides zeae]|uniref:ABC transporter substrate-binding protein n=1 Tax=Nocardioides imazamoxiresistens TaxID=3231893 RepID=A0ABU3PSP4_9ACTN|nr:ABC transporter substrate-binding protein [Nocardioides zeae]MDT9592211.1 ABC transporter substrate-binding protein [Nocardioides zeae]